MRFPAQSFGRRPKAGGRALLLAAGALLAAGQARAQAWTPKQDIPLVLDGLISPETERPPLVAWPHFNPSHIQSQPVYKDGGHAGMMRTIYRNLHWPASPLAKTLCVEGKVWVTFDVGSDGKVYDARVVESLHPLWDAEAVKAVRALGEFTPGMDNNQPVTVGFTVAVVFKLE